MANNDDDLQIDDQASYPDPFQARDDGFFNPKLNEPHLPQDYDTPAAPPTDVRDPRTKDLPQGDTNVDPSEAYDEGNYSATDADAQEG